MGRGMRKEEGRRRKGRGTKGKGREGWKVREGGRGSDRKG